MNPTNDVEMKNALAVKTVRAHGVLAIDDLYTAITAICGAVYRNCSLCDDESQFHPQGQCGYHYSGPGWKVLADQTLSYFNAALVNLHAPALIHVAATGGKSNGGADVANVAGAANIADVAGIAGAGTGTVTDTLVGNVSGTTISGGSRTQPSWLNFRHQGAWVAGRCPVIPSFPTRFHMCT
jgi:hypothetical protein